MLILLLLIKNVYDIVKNINVAIPKPLIGEKFVNQ